MTVLLILFTLILFLIADFIVQRKQQKAHVYMPVLSNAGGEHYHALPAMTNLATNHTWMRKSADGSAVVGVDDFLARLLGPLQEVMLPEPGMSLAPVRADIYLKAAGKMLKLATPVQGRVVDVNSDVLQNPALLREDPYERGWLMKIRPTGERTSGWFVPNPMEWLAKQTELAGRFFSSFTPNTQLVTVQDGGLPVEGLLQTVDGKAWNEFQSAFVTLRTVEGNDGKENGQ